MVILNQNNPHSNNEWDKSWFTSIAEFQLGSFTGNFKTNVQINDFALFYNQLLIQNNTLKENSYFKTRESQIEIELKNEGLGIIEVNFTLMDKVGIGNQLEASFKIDQTYIPSILQQLENILNTYKNFNLK